MVASSAQAAGWDEQFNGMQPQQQQLIPQFQPTRKGVALMALDRLDVLPKPIHKALVLKEDEHGSAIMQYNLNRHAAGISLRITF